MQLGVDPGTLRYWVEEDIMLFRIVVTDGKVGLKIFLLSIQEEINLLEEGGILLLLL